MPITLDGTNGITQAGEFNSDSSFGFKNRIINGAMVINQRALGTTTINSGSAWVYTLDRWSAIGETALGVYTLQQSSTAPAGFVNSLLATVTTSTSPSSGNLYVIRQVIEGNNLYDLSWGTASAKTVTLSFQVYSSLTGTFGGVIKNGAENRSYPFTYTVSSANTWTPISVTIAGDTSGTWTATTGAGMNVYFSLGAGSSVSGTAGAWAGSNFYGATGQTNIIATNGATFYITGVQLEVGSTATSFDYRPYGTELQLCQRYYVQYGGTSTNEHLPMVAQVQGTTNANTSFQLPVQMRTTPSITQASTWQANIYGGSSQNISSFAISDSTPLVARLDITLAGSLGSAGQCARMLSTSTAARLNFSAEL